MDEQGHGTEQWKSLEHWALDEIMKIVELRDGRTMDGPSDLGLQDFVGKRLRVRHATEEQGRTGLEEHGTLIFTITSVQARRRSIVFGVTPHMFFLETKGRTLTIRSVRYDLLRASGPVTAARFSVLRDRMDIRGEPADTRLDGLQPTNVHVLWS